MIGRTGAIAGSVFMDAIRRRVVYAVGFFGLVLAFGIPSLPSYGLGVVAGVYREVALALTFVASLILVLALAANRVPAEIERRTVYNVLAKPVRRLEYLAGTWAGIVGVMAGAIVAFTLIEQVVGLLRYQDPMWRLWEGALAIGLEMGVIAAFAVAVSALAGAVVVSIASLTLVFIGHSRDTLLGSGSSLARTLYPSLDTFNIINPVAHGTGGDGLYVAGMLVAIVGWVGALLLLAAAGFARRDL